MKKVKKIFALLIAMVMVLGMGVSVFAASIDVKEVIDGETYTAYKILNYTTNEDKSAVSYYLAKEEYETLGEVLEAAGFAFTPSADGSQYVLNNADAIDAAKAASKLKANANQLGDALGKFAAVGQNGEATFANLGPGYYFITSTAGSLAALHDEEDIATVVEKNTVTTLDKKQGEADGTYADDQLNLNIGDTVYYDVELTIGKGANYDLTLTDTLTDGLDLNQQTDAFKITVGGQTVTAGDTNDTKYSLSTKPHGFTLTFTAAYISTLKEGDVIEVEYSAVINQNAVIRDEEKNIAEISYSNQQFTDETVVKTYDVNLKKADGEGEDAKPLSGAKFKLYREEKGGTALKFSKDGKGYYLDAGSSDASDKIDAGDGTGVNIRGLKPGTYWFEETEAPAGYNKLSARVSVTVKADAEEAAEITVVNKAGSALPSTGGIGTTVFYIIGAILVIGAGVILVTRRRMSAR